LRPTTCPTRALLPGSNNHG